MAETAASVLAMIKEKEIEWVDLRFTDPKGKWQHLTMVAGVVDEDMLSDGFMFDGSSIDGWKAINESDMILMPDLDATYIDPFSATPMLILICDIVEPSTGQLYGRDPRSTAKRGEAYLKTTGIGDTIYIGPEAEFFVFDDVRFKLGYNVGSYELDDIELPTNTNTRYDEGNMGHRPRVKGGYFPVAPVDSAVDLRAEMVSTMMEMGLPCDKHHHEVAAAQHELGLTYGTLTTTADRMQVYKYVVHQVAHAYGKTATFMPKPIKDDNGSGMHTHLSIWNGSTPLFAGDGYAGLSETALYFIGGIIKHAKACNAFTNPSTNSYKRLVPGFEAPVLLAYSSRNRSGVVPHPLRHRRQVEARRGPLPRRDGQPVPVLHRAADGRPRRHREQDPPRRADGQEPLRPAPARAEEGPDGVREPARGARRSGPQPRGLHQGRGIHRRPDHVVHRAEDARRPALGDDAGTGGIRYVLQLVSGLR